MQTKHWRIHPSICPSVVCTYSHRATISAVRWERVYSRWDPSHVHRSVDLWSYHGSSRHTRWDHSGSVSWTGAPWSRTLASSHVSSPPADHGPFVAWMTADSAGCSFGRPTIGAQWSAVGTFHARSLMWMCAGFVCVSMRQFGWNSTWNQTKAFVFKTKKLATNVVKSKANGWNHELIWRTFVQQSL